MGSGRIQLFIRGSDYSLWEMVSNDGGDNWGSWAFLGGLLNSGPVVTSDLSGRMDVFALGFDRAIWQKTYDPTTGFGRWQSVGGQFTSSPAAVSWGLDRIDLFGRGLDKALWHRAFYSGPDLGWQSLGGVLTTGPGVGAWASDRLDVFAGGQDRALWHKAWDGTAWSEWQSLGGYLTGDPAASSVAPNQLDVFVRGGDRAMWRRTWNGSSWTTWQSLGGVFLAGSDSLPVTARALPSKIVPGSDWTVLPTSNKIVALTFEGHAGAEGLMDRPNHPSILTTLRLKNVPATFFITGQWVENFPDQAGPLLGNTTHSIGNLSYDHPYLTQLPNDDVAREIAAGERAIWRASGPNARQTAPLFRFPHGDRDSRTIQVANTLGYGSISWTVDTLGWEGQTDPATGNSTGQSVDTVTNRAVDAARPGEIIRMQIGAAPDGSTLDADALGQIIDRLSAQGYSFVAIGSFIAS
jgi:peptidoglycan/xylan/chitin deacetylase (PgdA/CDA1 family)